MTLYNDYQSAEVDVARTILKLKAMWNKTESQLAFLRRIWDTLGPDFQTNQVLLLAQLENQLQQSTKLLNSIIGLNSEPNGLPTLLAKKGSLRQGKYVLSVKDSLQASLSNIAEWSELFDPSWFLLSRVVDSKLDQDLKLQPKDEPFRLLAGLRKSVRELNANVPETPIQAINSRDFLSSRQPIASSTIKFGLLEGRNQYALVDTMPVDPNMDSTGTTRSVVALSKALSRTDPAIFGLLRCCGVINRTEEYELVFEIPRDLRTPRSLRDLLHGPLPSLNTRIELAKQLARSVLYVHATGFVHKNIRPETIIVFDRGEGSQSLYLCGFENFRATEDKTFFTGDSLPERELYRHPLRQGGNPERKYMMQHDIYSLGVCLLEIGLWRSFVRTAERETQIEFVHQGDDNDPRKRAFAIKQQMMLVADAELAQWTGQRFKHVAEQCLTCLDQDTMWNRDENKSDAEVAVGIEFIENVLLQLYEIAV